ncbi:hypothetical protein AK830_g7009 [Neonectria ditissima]|uniref:Heterokaryon incompatibility domain-containing protein n=1 Tax=Neonectria ditissima TaxID=78410 RepID=A0A0P7BB46_9HYPO|nr:hypothetical protein AK830_g7009 [Neonectria ditissima]
MTPWASRGWTFQEEVMSNRLLYFTHCGLYYSTAGFPLEFSECLAEQVGSRPRLQSLRGSYWGALHSYSGRLFKYPKDDFLRAFSGLLFSMYGAETLWGLPQKHFDEALLWNETKGYNAERDSHAAFPSWSWTAASGVISSRENADPGSIEPISAVATWAFVPENAGSEKALTDRPDVTVLRPASELDHFSRSHRSSQDSQDAQRQASRLSAALVYFQGCVQIPPQGGDTEHDILDSVRRSPDSLRHHSRSDLDAAFQKRWPRYIDFWDDTLGSPLVGSHFSPSLVHAASISGRILVHTQKSSFRLDPLTSIDTRSARLGIPAVIRGTADNTPAGIIYHLREDWLQVAFAVDRVYEFIALSTETESLLNYSPWIFCFDRDVSMMSRFAGCTCSQPVVEGNLDGDIAHIPLCLRHPEFPSTPEGKSPWDSVAEKVSSSFACRDVNGANLVGDEHRFNKTRGGVFLGSQVASLNVMLVERSPEGEGIYKRVGLGKIFLKKWVESNPSFKALVLS